MKAQTNATNKIQESGENLMEDAEALLRATADVAGEKVMEARNRLSAAIDKGKEAFEVVQQRAIAGAKATDLVIRENPYKALGIALGTGLLVGYLLARRR